MTQPDTAAPAPTPEALISAMPSPWAHPVVFAEAVLDERHSLHSWALAQWRGLLTLCALQGQYAGDYALTVDAVVLDMANPLAAHLVAAAPDRAIAGGEGLWRAPMLLTARRKGWPDSVIGQINPLCLISPSRSFAEQWPLFGWMAGGLSDPLRAPQMPPPTDLAVLASWLSVLEGALAARKDGVCAQLHGHIHAFRQECLGHLQHVSVEVTAEAQVGCPLPAPFAALFTQSRIASIADPAALAKGRLALDFGTSSNSENVPPIRGVILVDPGLAHHYRIDARQIFVWGTRSLAEVMAEPALLAQIQAEAAGQGWLIITADDLLTRRMVRLNQQAVIASHPKDLRDCIMPLRPMALLLGDRLPELITARLRDDGAIVTLTLPMHDGRSIPLTRVYAKAPGPGQGEYIGAADWQIQSASIWPDFAADSFEYYAARLLSSDAVAQRNYVRASSVLSRALMLAMMRDCDRISDAMASWHKVNAGYPLPSVRGRVNSHTIQTGAEQETLWRAHSPFDAIGWHDKTDGREEAFCGLVLLSLPKRETRPLPLRVAVDFGTTNTVACFEDGAPIAFADRLLIPIQSANLGFTEARLHDRRYVYNKFFPRGERTLPTPSVAYSKGGGDVSALSGLFRNIILFPGTDAHADNGEARELQLLARDLERCHFNLKWSDDPAGNDAASDYLEQLVWMIAAEAAANGHDPRLLRWQFSVPDAMPNRRREQFRRLLEDLTGRVSAHVAPHETNSPRLAPLMSEGLAAAHRVLASGDTATQKLLTVIIDIGGATSDIALWDGSDVRWKGSFRLAGQDFFTRTLHLNLQLLDDIGLGFWARMLTQGGAMPGFRPGSLPHIAELLFSGDRLQMAIETHWDSHLAKSNGAVLRMAGLTFLGGMAWYLGQVAGGLLTEGALHYGRGSMPAFALCGRGAGLFRHIHGDLGPTGESDVTGALSLFSVAAALHDEPRPQLFLRPDPKLEVVRGMMTEAPRLRQATKNWSLRPGEPGAIASFTPVGLPIHYAQGVHYAAWMPIDAAIHAHRALHVDFDAFDTFLKALRHATGVHLDVRHGVAQASWDRIEHRVLASLEDHRHNSAGTPPEPPFIVALRALLQELIDPEARAQGRIVANMLD